MAFSNALGGLGNMLGQVDPQYAAGFAGGQYSAPRQVPQQQPKKRGIGIAEILGTIGDALLVANGRAPLYSAHRQQQKQQERQDQINAALANYMDDPEGAIRALMGIDAQAGIQLMNSRKPKGEPDEIELMRYGGIDPSSEEGRGLIRGLLSRGQSSSSSFARDLDALGIDPHSDEARELYYGRNSPPGYLLRPPSRRGASGPAVGTVVSGFRFRGGNPNDKGNWEPVNGGQTARPSGLFPGN